MPPTVSAFPLFADYRSAVLQWIVSPWGSPDQFPALLANLIAWLPIHVLPVRVCVVFGSFGLLWFGHGGYWLALCALALYALQHCAEQKELLCCLGVPQHRHGFNGSDGSPGPLLTSNKWPPLNAAIQYNVPRLKRLAVSRLSCSCGSVIATTPV